MTSELDGEKVLEDVCVGQQLLAIVELIGVATAAHLRSVESNVCVESNASPTVAGQLRAGRCTSVPISEDLDLHFGHCPDRPGTWRGHVAAAATYSEDYSLVARLGSPRLA